MRDGEETRVEQASEEDYSSASRPEGQGRQVSSEQEEMNTILIIFLIVILCGGFGWYGQSGGWAGPHLAYGGGGLGTILIVILLLWFFGVLR